jgi:hypothetical protein
MRRAWEVVLVVVVVLSLCAGFYLPFDFAFQVGLGWVLFVYRVLPEVTIDRGATATALVCLAGLAVGLHIFLNWLAGQIRKPRKQEAAAIPLWRARWTAMILALVVLLFVVGISAVGITHQTAWLLTSPGPLTHRSGGIREIAARVHSSNNLKQIGIAAHSYHDDHNGLPPGGTFDAQGNGLHGWQTLLLPYVEQEMLYKQIDLKSPWHSARNAPLLRQQIPPYQQSGVLETGDEEGFALTHYAANVRVMGAKRRTMKDITLGNGPANTILAGEVWTAYKPWGQPANWRDPARGIHTTQDSFGSAHDAGYAQFLCVDGSVRKVARTVNRATLEAASNPDRTDPMPEDW